MNYLIGFVVWWIALGVICLGVYCFERQTKKFVDLFRKYVQMIVYMLCMMIGYLILFLISYVWNMCQWKGSAFAWAIMLLIMWKFAYMVFCWIWRTRNRDTGANEYIIELSDAERQWCNSISIVGMIVIGIIMLVQNGEEDYFELISMAFSIWIGSYISIQKIQQKNTIQEVLGDLKKEFKVNSKMVPISSAIFMLITVCFNVLNFFEQARMVFDEMITGFVFGSCFFLLVVVLKNKLQNCFKLESKE